MCCSTWPCPAVALVDSHRQGGRRAGLMILLTAIVAERAGSPTRSSSTRSSPRDNFTFGEIRIVSEPPVCSPSPSSWSPSCWRRVPVHPLRHRHPAAAEDRGGALGTALAPSARHGQLGDQRGGGRPRCFIAPLVPSSPDLHLFIVPALASAVLGAFSAMLPAFVAPWPSACCGARRFLTGGTTGSPPGHRRDDPARARMGRPDRARPAVPTRGALVLQNLGRAPRPRSWTDPGPGRRRRRPAAVLGTSGKLRSASSLRHRRVISLRSWSHRLLRQISPRPDDARRVAGFILSPLTDSGASRSVAT